MTVGHSLREMGVTTFLSHASLALDEGCRAEARDCVIVATSILEMGIDAGDLYRAIQINGPDTWPSTPCPRAWPTWTGRALLDEPTRFVTLGW